MTAPRASSATRASSWQPAPGELRRRTGTGRSGGRPAPRGRRRGGRLWLPGVAAVVVLVLVAAAGIWVWSRQQCFVTARDGQVVVAGGLPGLWPSTRQVVDDVPLDRLPGYLQAQLDAGMRAANCDGAVTTVLGTLRSSVGPR